MLVHLGFGSESVTIFYNSIISLIASETISTEFFPMGKVRFSLL